MLGPNFRFRLAVLLSLAVGKSRPPYTCVSMLASRILVVDDEELIREAICSMLSFANLRCDQAGDGIEALRVLQSGKEYELMLSDLNMPGMDGDALLTVAKQRYPEMSILVLTAVHDVSVALNTIRSGAYDYLLKHFNRDQLLATTRRALEVRRLKLENRASVRISGSRGDNKMVWEAI